MLQRAADAMMWYLRSRNVGRPGDELDQWTRLADDGELAEGVCEPPDKKKDDDKIHVGYIESM